MEHAYHCNRTPIRNVSFVSCIVIASNYFTDRHTTYPLPHPLRKGRPAFQGKQEEKGDGIFTLLGGKLGETFPFLGSILCSKTKTSNENSTFWNETPAKAFSPEWRYYRVFSSERATIRLRAFIKPSPPPLKIPPFFIVSDPEYY